MLVCMLALIVSVAARYLSDFGPERRGVLADEIRHNLDMDANGLDESFWLRHNVSKRQTLSQKTLAVIELLLFIDQEFEKRVKQRQGERNTDVDAEVKQLFRELRKMLQQAGYEVRELATIKMGSSSLPKAKSPRDAHIAFWTLAKKQYYHQYVYDAAVLVTGHHYDLMLGTDTGYAPPGKTICTPDAVGLVEYIYGA